MEYDRTGTGCQIFCKISYAGKDISAKCGKYCRTAYCHTYGPSLFFIYHGASVPVYDGTVSDCITAGFGI